MRPIALGRFGSGGRSKNNSSNNSSNDRGAAFRRGRVGSRRVNNSNGRMNSSNNNSSRGLRGRSLRCRNQSSSSNGQVSNGRTNRGNNPLTSALQHTVSTFMCLRVGSLALLCHFTQKSEEDIKSERVAEYTRDISGTLTWN